MLLYLCVTYAGAAGGFGGADARRLGRCRIPRALQQQLLPQVPGAQLCFTSSSCLAHVALYCVRGLAGSRACCAVLELESVAPCMRVMDCSSLGALEAVHLHAFGKCLQIHRKCFDSLRVLPAGQGQEGGARGRLGEVVRGRVVPWAWGVVSQVPAEHVGAAAD